MCGVNFTLFGCEEKILSNVHIVQCTAMQYDLSFQKSQKVRNSAVLPTSRQHCRLSTFTFLMKLKLRRLPEPAAAEFPQIRYFTV